MRLRSLDSLRGIAAVVVVIYHSLLVFPYTYEILGGRGVPFAENGDIWALLLTVTPPSLLWAGREAVLLFFVLSGFVLALPFDAPPGTRPRLLPFTAKRVVRLLLPCAAVAAILGLLVPALDVAPRPELSGWVDGSWQEPVTPGLVLRHALLLGGEYTLNNPMWTLHYELRVSLIFPAMMALAALGNTVLAGAAIAGVLVCLVEMKFIGTGLLTTLLFVPHFALGALLARHRDAVAGWVLRRGSLATVALWLLCYLLLTFRWLVPLGGLACDLANGVGAGLLIALIIGSPRATVALQARTLLRLGAISYSLYLVHVPVLLTGLHFAPAAPAWVIAAAAPALSVLAAMLLHRWVEEPAIRLGRQIAGWLDPRRPDRSVLAPSR
jgi:peptidoglycan/LPS O-acetylase OafA/YrhL